MLLVEVNVKGLIVSEYKANIDDFAVKKEVGDDS